MGAVADRKDGSAVGGLLDSELTWTFHPGFQY
jgi:hypothetical protein